MTSPSSQVLVRHLMYDFPQKLNTTVEIQMYGVLMVDSCVFWFLVKVTLLYQMSLSAQLFISINKMIYMPNDQNFLFFVKSVYTLS